MNNFESLGFWGFGTEHYAENQTILDNMRALDFIDRKVASIYLNNYDGVNEEKI